LSQTELDQLDSDALIAYIRDADQAGRRDEAQRALGVLCFRHYDNVKRRVSIRVPWADVEDVAQEVMASSIKSAFDGTAVGQFVNWLNRIVDRRVADYHRRKESRPTEVALPEEHEQAEDIWGEAAVVGPEEPTIDVERKIDAALPESKVHRRVIDIYVFDDQDARTTADRINQEFPDLDPSMSVDNVQQIASRFRKNLRGMLDEEG